MLFEEMVLHVLRRAGTTVSIFTVVFPELAWHIGAHYIFAE